MKKKIGLILIIIILFITIPYFVKGKTQGNLKQDFANVVIFAEFSDNTGYFQNSDKRREILDCFDGSSKRSFSNYMSEISYGQFKVHNIFPQDDGSKITPIKLSYTKQQAINGNIDSQIISEIIRNVKIKETELVDYNNDGIIDNLTIILPGGCGNTPTTPTLYPHKSNYAGTEKWNQKSIREYNILNTERLIDNTLPERSTVIAHEFMHTLGYPDLYTENGTTPVGIWDIMASSSMFIQYPLAYMRMYVSNWINIDTITKNQTLTLDMQNNPNGNQAYILKSPLNEQEFFVVEFRKKAESYDMESYDSKIGGSGLIVYRINTTVEQLSNHSGKTGVYIFRPQTGFLDEKNAVNNAFLSQESGRTSIGNSDMSKTEKDGAITFSDGTNSGIVINNISSSSGNTMTCQVTFPSEDKLDLWKNMNYPSQPSETWDKKKDISMIENQGKIYTISFENGKYQGYEYDGTIWKSFGNAINNKENVQMKLEIYQNNLYLAYIEMGDMSNNFLIKKYENGIWKDIGKIENSNNFDIKASSNGLYIAYDDNYNSANLKKLEDDNIQTIGQYFKGFCGQPKIVTMQGKIFVSIRSAKGNQIHVYEVNDKQFTDKTNTQIQANTYDIESDGKKIYILLGGTNLTMTSFDGTTWKTETPLTGISAYEPSLSVAKGNIYATITPQTDTGRTKVYQYGLDSKWKQEGNDIDSIGENFTLTSIQDQLVLSYVRKIDNRIIIRTKKMVQPSELISLTINNLPIKTKYKIGESISTNGLEIVANYTNGTQILKPEEYIITGFDTKTSGNKVATITYGGKQTTFSYQVEAPEITLQKITITPPTKTKYLIGEQFVSNGIMITGEYSNGSKKIIPLSDCKITGFDTTKIGTKNIIVSYGEKTALFNINVEEKVPNVIYSTHVQNLGWQSNKRNGETAGTSGKSLRLEGIKINIDNNSYSGGIKYSVHVQNIGWQNYVQNGNIGGTTGKSLRLEAIKIELTGEMANNYDIYYRTHVENIGWLDWAKNGQESGTQDHSYRLEGIEIRIVKKGQKAPGNTIRPFVRKNIKYSTHVQNVGWQADKIDGETAGTSGKSLRLEGICISLISPKYSGEIVYSTHVQNIGWQEWKKNGNASGTSGKGLRLEAIKIQLTGEMAKHYDIYYRTHIQDIGWQDWKKNGDISGTSGQSKRLEAIEIKLVEK